MMLWQVANWSRLGRLKRSKVPNLGGGGHIFGGGASTGLLSVLAGRLLCDTYLAARELVKSIDYTLATLSQSLLGQSRHELCAADVPGVGPCH
jgi:DNA polymerase alpha subunit A